jgi:hypothetical protein
MYREQTEPPENNSQIINPQKDLKEQPEPEKNTLQLTKYQENLLGLLANGNKQRERVLLDYWQSLASMKESAANEPESKKHSKRIPKNLNEDKESARNLVEGLIENKIFPIVTMPQEYWQTIKKKGSDIVAHETFIPGVKVIAGTIGIGPYHADNDRAVLRIKCSPEDVMPRISGDINTFNGVVYFVKDRIPFAQIEEIKTPANSATV